MEEEDFIITVDTSISTSINNLNHKSIQPYYLKYKNIKNIAGVYSRLIDVFGDIKSELAEFYNASVNIEETSLVPCFRFKEGASYPLRDGNGVIFSAKKYTPTKSVKYGSEYIIVNFKDFCNENDKQYEELRHILIKNENNKQIARKLAEFIQKTNIITVSASKEYNINLGEVGMTKTIVNVIKSMHKMKNYKIGINSDINSLMEGKYFDVVMNYDDIKSITESREKQNKNLNNINIIRNTLKEYYLNIYDSSNSANSIEQKINDYIEKFTKSDQTSIETSCPHKLLVYNVMYSDKISKFNIKKNAKKLEGYYDNMYNREQMIICNACGENMICPHNVMLLKMIDDSEFNKKTAISNYIIYNRKQKTAVCKVCKAELFGYDNMQSIEYYSLDDYIYKEMSEDKLYKLIYKHINIYIRLPSITTNEAILSKKDVIDMCIPCIYQITQTNAQNYLKNNILSNEMKNDVLNLFAMIYCAAFINILSKKLKTKGGFITLLNVAGNMHDILANMYNQFISLNKNTHTVEYSQIYNEAITNIHSNIGIILNYIKNSKTNKIRQSSKTGLDIYWGYLIPDKRIFTALNYDMKLDGDLFFNSIITNKDVYDIINIYPKNYQKDFILTSKGYNYFDYGAINSNKYKNSAKPPLYILYDLNGDKHDFKRDSNGNIKCSVCGWDYKNIEKYSANLDEVISVLEIKQFLAKIKKFCPINVSHTYSAKSIECSACGYVGNWDVNSKAAINYYNKYKDKLDNRVMIAKETSIDKNLNQKYYIEKKNAVRDIILKNNTNSKLIDKILNENKDIKSMFDKVMDDNNYLISVILHLIRILSRILVDNTLTEDDDEREILNMMKQVYYSKQDKATEKIITEIIKEKNEICDFKNIILASNDSNIFEDMNFFIMYLKSVIYNIFAFVAVKLNLKIFTYIVKAIYGSYIKYIKVYNKKAPNNAAYSGNIAVEDDDDSNNISAASLEDSSNEFAEEENQDNINDEDNEDLDFKKDEPEDYENGRFLAGLSKEEE